MKFNRKISDLENMTLEEALYFHEVGGWCFEIGDRKIKEISFDMKKRAKK